MTIHQNLEKSPTFWPFNADHQTSMDNPGKTSEFFTWTKETWESSSELTYFGFVLEGPSTLKCASGIFTVQSEMYFTVTGPFSIQGGCGLLIPAPLPYKGVFSLGGPVESRGRLKYIDGCTDSLLVPPLMRGDPCLNYLHLPKRTTQSSHTHPAFRMGMTIKGHGTCVTPLHKQTLNKGDIFYIPPDCFHCFHTTDSELFVFAFHPDSDTGPTNENHPMLNKTILPKLATTGLRSGK